MLMPNGVGTFHVKVLRCRGGPGLTLAIEGRERGRGWGESFREERNELEKGRKKRKKNEKVEKNETGGRE